MADVQFTPRQAPKRSWNFFSWTPTSPSLAQEAEARLLSRMIYFRRDDAEKENHSHEMIARVGLVDLGEGRMINTLVIDRISESERTLPHKNVLVMCHGYGAGLGFFYRNYAGLSQSLSHDYRIYALDWLGMANSSRPAFPRIPRNASDKDIVDTAEDFFVSSLEKWREKMRIEKMTLMGHSLGGYLATAYTEKHPDRVSKLILVSPAGVSEPPPEALSLQQSKQLPLLYRFFRHLWSQNITPMSLVRVTGPYGPTLVSKYTTRRFAHLPTLDSTDLHSYIYHISAQRGSGEYALSHLLLPGAWARIPLPSRLRKLTVPTSFVYGDSDWMDYRAAVKVVQEEGGMRPEAAPRIVRVKSAGHHLYLDNPEGFNDALVAEVKGVADRESELIEYVHT
ncbi:Alpha/Beta hydrolase protein [Gaertneriomyces semiglobifer]|nr:Alpha/Beta hydrolase protein [Gaertneriomyces semiglobifer]